ncbi:DNA topoisomerase IB [Maribellus comscasis]|uniref:DNA topoisomerase n=1 Tax=Maribellus comscasis TaxID=2681766 RepID=A0A6I6K7W7_9BACT|nr:DNA topoisomerase IB [Maribellus comscasis]QGY47693.1 DNA topoisomerase IB [Maribellus comscasis]
MKNINIPSSLVHVTDTEAGYKRLLKNGEKFIYQDEKGKRIRDKATLERIEKLVIPPMWEDVWICKKHNGHLQATGRDVKGRKQYLYHAVWNEHINLEKFNGLLDFAQSLPKIRAKINRNLRKRAWVKEKVVALAIKVMDELYLRIGNKRYMKENDTYGLTTLRKKHLKETSEGLTIKYMAKSGKLRKISVNHPTLKKHLKACAELPGYEIFRYQEGEKYYPVESQDINEYLREISGKDITAKSFRTWGGTVLTVELAPIARKIVEENPRKKFETTLVSMVADELNNTVSVCRKYYIHPVILKAVVNGDTERIKVSSSSKSAKWYRPEELVVLKILKTERNKSKRIPA